MLLCIGPHRNTQELRDRVIALLCERNSQVESFVHLERLFDDLGAAKAIGRTLTFTIACLAAFVWAFMGFEHPLTGTRAAPAARDDR